MLRGLFKKEDTAVEEVNICERVSSHDPNAHLRLGQRLRHYVSSLRRIPNQPLLILCIGTDRSTGDALGPLVGSKLKKSSFKNVIIMGCLDEPVHALNLEDYIQSIKELPIKPLVIAVDASLGNPEAVGHITLKNGPLIPGAGVNKVLPPVGDIHMTGVVNVKGFMEYVVLQNTRLSLVMKMSSVLADSIYTALEGLV